MVIVRVSISFDVRHQKRPNSLGNEVESLQVRLSNHLLYHEPSSSQYSVIDGGFTQRYSIRIVACEKPPRRCCISLYWQLAIRSIALIRSRRSFQDRQAYSRVLAFLDTLQFHSLCASTHIQIMKFVFSKTTSVASFVDKTRIETLLALRPLPMLIRPNFHSKNRWPRSGNYLYYGSHQSYHLLPWVTSHTL